MRNFTLLILLFSVLNFYSQEKKEIIYEAQDGKLMNESEYLALKNGFQKTMEQKEKNGELREKIQDSIVKNKIYKKFQLTFVSTTNTTAEERIEMYLNKKFPENKLTTLDDKELKLSELQGKPTFITFWFTQCAPCIKELPALKELKNKYGNKVNFLAITFNEKEKVKLFLQKREFDYRHIVGANDFINNIGLNTYPRNIILDKNGTVKMIKNEIPYNKKMINNEQILEFDLSEYERELENLL